MLFLLTLFALLLAFVNGGNDNLKGMATVIGARVLTYRKAVTVASIATAAGAVASIFLAGTLVATFSGKGLLPDTLVQSEGFIVWVAGGAMATVALATRIGMPISTTHALVGALVGVGFALAPQELQLSALGKTVVLPLLTSPVIAFVFCFLLIKVLSWFGIAKPAESVCVCIDAPVSTGSDGAAMSSAAMLTIDKTTTCAADGRTTVATLRPSAWLDGLHIVSGSAVCFARGLNDTPKMAALMIAATYSGVSAAATVALVMVLGGMLTARRVMKTMSEDITPISPEDGTTGNLVTSLVVIGASIAALPVSTTHVSCGALFGMASARGQGQLRTILTILLAWVLTLPTSAVTTYVIARLFG